MKEKFIVSIISQIISTLINIIANYILVFNLSITLLGIWTFLISIINLGFLFVDIGFKIIHFQYAGEKNHSSYFSTFLLINLIIIAINTGFSLILITSLQFWESNNISFLLILLISKIVFEITNIFLFNLKSRIKVFKSEIPYLINNLGKSISTIYVALNLSSIADPILFLCIIQIFFNSIFLILILFFSKNEIILIKPNKTLAVNYLKDVKPLLIYSIIYVFANNIGNLIINYAVGPEYLGYYSIINTYIIVILLTVSGSLIPICLSIYSKLFELNKLESIKEISYRLEKYFSILFLSLIILILLNGEEFFLIFLPKYMKSIPVLNIMIFIPYLVGITRPYSFVLVSGKKQKLTSTINSITNALIIILMITFIPQTFLGFKMFGLGILGCALAQTIPWIIWLILNRLYVKKYYKIKSKKNTIMHLFLAFSSLFGALIIKEFILNNIFQNVIYLAVISSLMVLFLFFGLLFLIKELKREDIKFFIHIFNLKRYLISIRKEFSK